VTTITPDQLRAWSACVTPRWITSICGDRAGATALDVLDADLSAWNRLSLVLCHEDLLPLSTVQTFAAELERRLQGHRLPTYRQSGYQDWAAYAHQLHPAAAFESIEARCRAQSLALDGLLVAEANGCREAEIEWQIKRLRGFARGGTQ
jgi:hypothetical protein